MSTCLKFSGLFLFSFLKFEVIFAFGSNVVPFRTLDPLKINYRGIAILLLHILRTLGLNPYAQYYLSSFMTDNFFITCSSDVFTLPLVSSHLFIKVWHGIILWLYCGNIAEKLT